MDLADAENIIHLVTDADPYLEVDRMLRSGETYGVAAQRLEAQAASQGMMAKGGALVLMRALARLTLATEDERARWRERMERKR